MFEGVGCGNELLSAWFMKDELGSGVVLYIRISP